MQSRPTLFRKQKTARGKPETLAQQSLALVPLVVGLLLGALVLPRSVAPEEVLAPSVDGAALRATLGEDDARAARAEAEALPSPVRAVGSAFRAFNLAEAEGADATTLSQARDALARAGREVRADQVEALLDLRAYQMRSFLTEVRRFERTGVASAELRELGGTFLARMQKVGWIEGNHLLMPDVARRAAFKLTWNRSTFLETERRFELTLDETRTLYAFYFRHPHPSEADRRSVDALAADPAQRVRAAEVRAKATASWLMAKVGELAQLDAAYPAPLARAAALYLRRDFRGSAAIYEVWLHAHPDGEWTLRAQNHLRAALLAAEQSFQ